MDSMGSRGLEHIPTRDIAAAIANAVFRASETRLKHPLFTPDKLL